MTFISTIAKKFQHEKTARDVYFEALEEAYGNLPVPSDDWAEIKQLLLEQALKTWDKTPKEDVIKMIVEDFDKLQEATEIIMNHYIDVAEALGKETKYN
jgi:hypothetical protein